MQRFVPRDPGAAHRALFLLVVVGCGTAELDRCAVRCGVPGGACPAGLRCGADDYCHAEGDGALCTAAGDDGLGSDAAIGGRADGRSGDDTGGDDDAAGGSSAVPPGGLLVTDRTVGADRVVLLVDGNQDGDATDPGESVTLYDVADGGPLALNNAIAAHPSPSGAVFVINAGGVVLRLRDQDLDGRFAVSEANLFYQGPLLDNVQDLVVDPASVVFVANAGGALALDQVIRLEDRNGDGDALDAGEATPHAAVSALSLAWAPDGLFTETSQRLVDQNGDGDALDPLETIWYGTRPGAPAPFGVAYDPRGGHLHVQHRGAPNEISRLSDLNGDGDALDANEAVLAGVYGGASSVGIGFDREGRLYAVDDTVVYRLFVTELAAYDSQVFATGLQSSMRIHRALP